MFCSFNPIKFNWAYFCQAQARTSCAQAPQTLTHTHPLHIYIYIYIGHIRWFSKSFVKCSWRLMAQVARRKEGNNIATPTVTSIFCWFSLPSPSLHLFASACHKLQLSNFMLLHFAECLKIQTEKEGERVQNASKQAKRNKTKANKIETKTNENTSC